MPKRVLGLTITQTRLRELLEYDPDTGVFRWRKGGTGRYYPGRVAGATNVQGYRVISFGGERLRAARLAWLYMTGEWPDKHIDHINGDPGDDRWCNLREASESQNMSNVKLRAHNTSGAIGVSWNKRRGKWHARVNFELVTYHVGYFDSFEEAVKARDMKATQLHGAFAQLNNLVEGMRQ